MIEFESLCVHHKEPKLISFYMINGLYKKVVRPKFGVPCSKVGEIALQANCGEFDSLELHQRIITEVLDIF